MFIIALILIAIICINTTLIVLGLLFLRNDKKTGTGMYAPDYDEKLASQNVKLIR